MKSYRFFTSFKTVKSKTNSSVLNCKPHHMQAEKGQLDNIKISGLYFLDEFLA